MFARITVIVIICSILVLGLGLISREKAADTAVNKKEAVSAPETGDPAKSGKVPGWYLQNRVQIHTRLTLENIDDPEFFDFPAELAQYGVPVLTRQIKAFDEEPWWKSSVGTLNPTTLKYNEGNNNLAAKLIKDMHDNNMKAIIYYRHIEDQEMLSLHKNWASLDINGNLVKSVRGYEMCFNSPYRNCVITRLKELAKYGADGFYFDYIHILPHACFCDYCKALYKKQYNSNLVQDYKNGNILKFYEFRNNTIDRFFSDVKTNLESENKNIIFVVSGNTWPTLTDLHMNSEIFHKFILKSEVGVPSRATASKGIFAMPAGVQQKVSTFYLNAFYFSLMRDNSFAPPHIWCPRVNTNPALATSTAAALISLGCIANLDLPAKKAFIQNFKEPLSWNVKYGEYFRDLTPYAFTGVVVSEKDRNKFVKDPGKAWDELLYPAFDCFSKLYQAGIPTQILADASLTTNNINRLSTIYCNKSLSSLGGVTDKSKFEDFSNFNRIPSNQLGFSLKAPVFCIKQDEDFNVNYFQDSQGFIYIITGPDLSGNIKVRNKKVMSNLAAKAKRKNVTSSGYKLYIRKDFGAGQLQNLANKIMIKSSGEENGYYFFDINPEENTLGIMRFKLNK